MPFVPDNAKRSALRLALTTVVVVGVMWLGTRYGLYHLALADDGFSILTACFFLVLLRIRITLRELAAVLAITLAPFLTNTRLLGYPFSWRSAIFLLGLGGFCVLILRVLWSEGESRRLATFALLPLVALHAAGWCIPFFHGWTSRAQPDVLDLYLYSFDASLHVQPSFLFGQLMGRSYAFFAICYVAYLIPGIALALTYAGCLLAHKKKALSAFTAFFIAAPIGFVFYNFFPALGPIYVFKTGFPWYPLTTVQASHLAVKPIPLAGFRNAMPSLHAGWAYLVFWYSSRLSRLERILAAVFLVFTLITTLGTGEHYFIDLLVAVPFAVFILSLTNHLVHRPAKPSFTPLFAGLAMILVWFAALRFGLQFFWKSPVIPWAACLLTLAACFWVGRTLAKEQARGVIDFGGLPFPQRAPESSPVLNAEPETSSATLAR